MPAFGRHFSATVVQRGRRLLLFDCGEGTQFQFVQHGLKMPRIEAIFISHVHGDHLYGLPGLLSTLGLLGHTKPLTLVGPAGLEALMQHMPGISDGWLSYPITYQLLDDDFVGGIVYEGEGFTVEGQSLAHSIRCIGYRYAEHDTPGKLDVKRAKKLGVTDVRHYGALKAGEAVRTADGTVVQPEQVVGPPTLGATFAYVSDTAPCDGARLLARDATLLYHEATFMDEDRKRAVATGHSTARDAAEVACDARAQRLLLSHFSARYRTLDALVAEAQAVFPHAEAAIEGERYPLVSNPVV